MTTPARRPGVGPASEGDVTPSEQSYEDLYEHAPCGYLSTLADGTMVKVNDTFLTLTGYSRSDVVGQSFASLLSVGSALFYETRCLPVLRLKGEVHEVALVLRCLDGKSLSVLVNSTMRATSLGQQKLIRTAVFDSTGRRDYERDLLEARRAAELSEARVRVLQEASTTFGASKSEESLTTALAEIAREAFDATSTAVMLVSDAGMHLVAGTHPLDPSEHPEETRPEAVALRTGSVVTIGSIDEANHTFPALVESLLAARLEAVSVVPLLGDGSSLGVLICFFGRRREFDAHGLELQTALVRYAGQVLLRIRLQSELEHMALHDQLTGLANRELLRDRLSQVLSAAERHQRPMALVFLDLDGFKAINDHLGHTTGDSVLEQVSDRLRHVVRRNDTIARFGGDEFVVVCEDTDTEAAVLVSERIRVAIREPLTGVPPAFPLTASIGVALHHPNGGPVATADVMVRRADAAMYESKKSGKDRNTLVTV
ncbi:MAG TPA: diguanylate cyclase [Nocardioidaceae bacterium]|nr:diguanylate cyclase [Nocardioidaceae bacterium]